MKVNDRLEGIMKYSDEWQAAQSAIKKSYFSNIKDNEFDRFLIHGFIAVMTLFIIIVMLCLIKAKCCKKNR